MTVRICQCENLWVMMNPLKLTQDLIVNSPLKLLYISSYISYKELVLTQDNNFYLMHLGILVTCLLNNGWIL